MVPCSAGRRNFPERRRREDNSLRSQMHQRSTISGFSHGCVTVSERACALTNRGKKHGEGRISLRYASDCFMRRPKASAPSWMPAIKTVGLCKGLHSLPGCISGKQDKRLDSVEPDCPGHKKGRPETAFLNKVAKRTGLEPATSSVTGWRSNRTELPLPDLGCLPRPCGWDVEAYTRLYTPVTRKKVFFCNFSNRRKFVWW